MKRLLSVLSIAVLVLGQVSPAAALPAGACSCGAVTLGQRIEYGDATVTGTVRRVRGKDSEVAIVAVERYLKSSGPGAIIVFGGDPFRPDTCDVSFAGRQSERLLFFLSYDEELGYHYVDACSLSRPLAEEASQQFLKDVETLTGPGTPPSIGSVFLADATYFWRRTLEPISFTLAVGGTLLILVVGLWITRNREVSSVDVSKL